jgi:HD-GYP domain-containing protein (c-di-GMP phosphodiesterase class II)
MTNFNQRSLWQILRHEIVQDTLQRQAVLLGTSFGIVDEHHATLAGAADMTDGLRVPVLFSGNVIAWLIAPRYAEVLAVNLEGLIALEMEKKDVATDALEMYREINLLFHLHEVVGTSLNPIEVCETLTNEVQRLVSCEACMIFLGEGEGANEQLQAVAGATPRHRNALKTGEGIVGHVFTKGGSDIYNHVERDAHFAGETDYPAMMGTPLKTNDTMLGVMIAAGTGPFTANDLKLLTTLASHGAIVLRNAQLYTELHELFQSTVSVLAETIEKRDPYTAGHTQRVTDYSVMTAERLGLPEKEINDLRLSAILHDVGKIGVRDHILLKKSPLDHEEFQQMMRHPEHGADILNHSRLLRNIVDGVRYHHERFDGNGYNHGLQGYEIPLHARIIAVADAFDAMTTDRPYRRGMEFSAAIAEIIKGSGSQFDPAIAEAFLTSLTSRIRDKPDASCTIGNQE